MFLLEEESAKGVALMMMRQLLKKLSLLGSRKRNVKS
jgi:hypothetical protein